MKPIAVLEWIRGGGLRSVDAADIPQSLLAEGTAMLACLVNEFTASGNRVVCCIDSRWGTSDLPNSALVSYQPVPYQPVTNTEVVGAGPQAVPETWRAVAMECNAAIVIAPEIDGALHRTIAELRQCGVNLVNCDDPFLTNASDKWLTYRNWERHGIPTPPTILLSELDDIWISTAIAHAGDAYAGRWCIKPRDGAGSEDLVQITAHTASQLRRQWQSTIGEDRFIVQPWIEGTAYSRCAFVDASLKRRWYPMLTQELSDDHKYSGGRVVESQRAAELSEPTLNATLDALGSGSLGWVGLDLQRTRAGRWYAVEANPRFTTSICHLPRPLNLNVL